MPYLLDVQWMGVDVDPTVLIHHRMEHRQAVHPGYLDAGLRFDLVVGVFVMHFNMPISHLKAIVASMKPNGILLFNVYRRSDSHPDSTWQGRFTILGSRSLPP